MIGMLTTIALILLMLLNESVAEQKIKRAVDLPPVVCSKPIATTVPVDPLQQRYFPYFITLHRCQGSVQALNPQNVECVVVVQRELKITVFSTKTWTETELRVLNHTTCGQACKTKPSECLKKVQIWKPDTCACACLYGIRGPPEHIIPRPRKNGFRWSPNSCRYECSRIGACPAQKEWSHSACGCICTLSTVERCKYANKYLNASTCECEEQAENDTGPGVTGRRSSLGQHPRFQLPPPTKSVVLEGSQVDIPCQAIGKPEPLIKWYAGSVINPLQNDSKYNIAADGTLQIKNVSKHDAQTYKCIAGNLVGTVAKDTVVELASYPIFAVRPKNTTAFVDQDVWLHCNASGQPKPYIIWSKEVPGGYKLDPKRFIQYPNGTLHIKEVHFGDKGHYYCLAANDAGMKQSKFSLDVHRAVDLPPVVCSKPIATTVPVDALQQRYFPYFVTLHRCQGPVKALNPQNVKCVATVQRQLKITVRSTKTWTETELRVMNHTTCGPACKTNSTECLQKVQIWNPQTCTCECLYGVRGPPEHIIPRKNGFRWSSNSCRYECSRIGACPAQKEWSHSACGCICTRSTVERCKYANKYLNASTCECEEQAENDTGPGVTGRRSSP